MPDIFAMIQVRIPTGSPYREMERVNADTAALATAVTALEAAAKTIHPGASVVVVRQRLAQSPKAPAAADTTSGADTGAGDSLGGLGGDSLPAAADSGTGGDGGGEPTLPAAAAANADTGASGEAADRVEDPGAKGPRRSAKAAA